MAARTPNIPDPTRPVFWLRQITSHPNHPLPEARLMFHLAPEDGPEPAFQMPLGGLLGIVDNLVVARVVPAWRDKGDWRRRAGSLPRCGARLRPEHEIMLNAIGTRNRKRRSDVQRLIQIEVFGNTGQGPSRIALVPVSVILQCLCAAATLEAVPPLDPNWVRLAIPDWIVASIRHQTVTKDE